MLAEHNLLLHLGELCQCNSKSGFLGREGSGSKDIWSSYNHPTSVRKPKVNPNGGEKCQAAPPKGKAKNWNPQRIVKHAVKT